MTRTQELWKLPEPRRPEAEVGDRCAPVFRTAGACPIGTFDKHLFDGGRTERERKGKESSVTLAEQ